MAQKKIQKKSKNTQKKHLKKVKIAGLSDNPKGNQKNDEKDDSKIRPLGNRVLIRPFTKQELEPKNAFGIILPEAKSKEKAEQGIVLALGPGLVQDGKLIPMHVKVGDTVAFSKYGYEDIWVDSEELYLIKEDNVLAVLKK